jgi:hypothetical protein
MNGTRARTIRRQAFQETGDNPVEFEKRLYQMHCPDSKRGLMLSGKFFGTLVNTGGRRLYRILKKKYVGDLRDGRI